MKKLLLALVIVILVTIPFALASEFEVSPVSEATKTRASTSSLDIPLKEGSATWTSIKGITLDVSTETVATITGITPALHSLDGGSKWIVGAPGVPSMKKLFDKGGELVLFFGAVDKKKPNEEGKDGYAYITFPSIAKRDKANPDKLKPLYTADDKLNLAEKGAEKYADAVTGYEYAVSGTDGKLPANPVWESFSSATEGIDVTVAPPKGTKKTTYFFRVKPVNSSTEIKGGSKAWKVTPATFGKAPKYKIDYKKEIIKGKAGMVIGSTATSLASMSSLDLLTEGFDKALEGKDEIKVGSRITDSGDLYLPIYNAATGKKPRSDVQCLIIVPRADQVASLAVDAKGKVSNANTLQFKLGDDWVKVPKITEDMTSITVRLASTAKVDKDNKYGSTRAAGAETTFALTITMEDGKIKSITAAKS